MTDLTRGKSRFKLSGFKSHLLHLESELRLNSLISKSLGSQYANTKYKKPMSTGGRIALEIKRALNTGQLHELVT
jgi:hypothetical protein